MSEPLTKDNCYFEGVERFYSEDDLLSALEGLKKDICIHASANNTEHNSICEKCNAFNKWFPILKDRGVVS